MEFKSLDEILKFAIQREKEAVDFYSKLAKKAVRQSIKEVFEGFVEEEKKHVALFQDFSANKEKIDSYEFKDVTDLKISDYIMDIEYNDNMAMPEILKMAMKREEKAVNLYTALISKTDNEQAQKAFRFIAQEEKKHKLILETMYDDYLSTQDN